MRILGAELRRPGSLSPPSAILLSTLVVALGASVLVGLGLALKPTQLALALCAGSALGQLYGVTFGLHGLKSVVVKALLAVFLYLAALPVTSLLGFMLDEYL